MLKYLVSISLCFKLCVFLQLEHRVNTALQDCVKQTMEKIFDYDDTILFVNFENEDIFHKPILNPYMILNYPILKKVKRIEKVISNNINTVLHLKDYNNTKFVAIGFQEWLRLYINTYPPTRTTIYITYISAADELLYIFKRLWAINVINVAVIAYDSNNNFRVYYANPNAPENECATKFKNFISTNCNSTFKYKFPNIMRKYPNCSVRFLTDENDDPYKGIVKSVSIVTYILQTVTKLLDMKLYEYSISKYNWSITFPVYFVTSESLSFATPTTVSFIQDEIYWIVPTPTKISPLEVLKLVFKPIVWVFILMAFLLTVFTWWAIVKYCSRQENNDCFAIFLQVFSITILASANRPPTTLPLRFIFMMYLIYSIHIETAFTSNLVQLLTVPQYENQIKNLQDFENSNISIFTSSRIYNWNLKNQNFYKSLSARLKERNESEIINIIRQSSIDNISIILPEDLFYFYRRGVKNKIYYFVDNSYSGTLKMSFATLPLSYFWNTLNEIVVRLIESGIINNMIIDFRTKEKIYDIRQSDADAAQYDKVVITLEHVYSIFLIWGAGLVLAFLAFIGEHLTYFIKRRKVKRLKHRVIHVSNR